MTDGGVSLSVDGHADRDQLADQLLAEIRYIIRAVHKGDAPSVLTDYAMRLIERDRRAVRRAALLEAAAWLEEELAHAAANGHRLDAACQGVAPGKRVPAVRSASIDAVIFRARAEAGEL